VKMKEVYVLSLLCNLMQNPILKKPVVSALAYMLFDETLNSVKPTAENDHEESPERKGGY
jgi:hypothetical protein